MEIKTYGKFRWIWWLNYDQKKLNILITGADGFIGSHLTEKLLSLGHKVTALSMYNSFGHLGG